MIKKTFSEFVDRKKRDSIKQLQVVEKILQHQGLQVESFLKEDDPYLYCHNDQRGSSFKGIRIYKIGEQIAFRIQKENKTHPFGRAYPLAIEDMFHDFLSDENTKEPEAGKKVIESVGKELKKFFEKSLAAEKESQNTEAGELSFRSQVTDYSNSIYSRL